MADLVFLLIKWQLLISFRLRFGPAVLHCVSILSTFAAVSLSNFDFYIARSLRADCIVTLIILTPVSLLERLLHLPVFVKLVGRIKPLSWVKPTSASIEMVRLSKITIRSIRVCILTFMLFQ